MIEKNNNMGSKISVIVPVYNGEECISRCVDSIILQSFTDWELILIDDGSVDASCLICDDYAQKDTRIKVVHKKNGGVSTARNRGIEEAHGEYVLFVDADDYLEDNYLQQISGCNEDIIIMPFKELYSDGTVKLFSPFGNISFDNKDDLLLFLQANLANRIFVTPWGKFIKRELLNNIRFNVNLRLGEDTIFNFSILEQANSLRSLVGASYMYKAEENFTEKYQMSVEKSIYSIIETYKVYEKLGIESSHSRSIFVCFLMLCEDDVVKRPQVWLNNKEIESINRYKRDFLFKEQIKYLLFQHQWMFRILRRFSHKIKPI